MHQNGSQLQKYGLWSLSLLCMALFALYVSFLNVQAHQSAEAKIAPELVETSRLQPQEEVRVMILGRSDAVAQAIEWVGGTVVRDLPIIDATVARVPARDLTAIAAQPSVQRISPDGAVQGSALQLKKGEPGTGKKGDASSFLNLYLDTLNVRPVWEMGLRGEGIGIAVIDSGIDTLLDFGADMGLERSHSDSRILDTIAFNGSDNLDDLSGHGTHVAGIISGNGVQSDGLYRGIAPMANLIALNISDEKGRAYESDSVAAMLWVLENRERYNIRVVNLSINSTAESSYHESGMNAAAELLWLNGVVVVASAGNNLSEGINPARAAPSNDPFIITVGASDERVTGDPADDRKSQLTAHAITKDGFAKPDLLAPGVEIVSVLAEDSEWASRYPDRVVGESYFRASGSSMAAPMVAGAAALLLQSNPNLTPDQVKQRLLDSGPSISAEIDADVGTLPHQYPLLDLYQAVTSDSLVSANQGLQVSRFLNPEAGVNGDTSIDWHRID